MCGIAGIEWPDEYLDREYLLKECLENMAHRGPDSAGLYLTNKFGFAHTRLAILDVTGGEQPFVGDNGCVLLFNGEIFNHEELRNNLKKKGYQFHTRSDTEVLFRFLSHYKEKALTLLDGQFALAFYDTSTDELILARDRFGEKPLYYCDEDHIVFASEIRPLCTLSQKSPNLCKKNFLSCASLWSPIPGQSAFEGVRSIPPGYFLKYRNGQKTLRRFAEVSKIQTSENNEKCNINETIQSAVRSRMQGDRTVGVYLSGGLDSTIVAYELNKLINGPLMSFSVTFDDDDLYDESKYQKTVARWLGTEHVAVSVDQETFFSNLVEATLSSETPSPRSAFVSMFALAKSAAAKSIQVVLTGEGADEVFLGYDLFLQTLIKREMENGNYSQYLIEKLGKLDAYQFNVSKAKKLGALKAKRLKDLISIKHPLVPHYERMNLASQIHQLLEGMTDDVSKFEEEWITYLENKYHNFLTFDEIDRAVFVEIESLLSGHLLSVQGDRMSMAWSVETRAPFLASSVFAAARQHTIDELFGRKMEPKALLKENYKHLLPEKILSRRKFPFRAPIWRAFNSKIGKAFIYDLIEQSNDEKSIFCKVGAIKFIERYFSNRNASPRLDQSLMLLSTGMILEQHFEQDQSRKKRSFTEVKRKIIGSDLLISLMATKDAFGKGISSVASM